MDILFIASSTYNDPFAEEWNPDLRYTASFLRRQGVDAGFVYLPLLDGATTVPEPVVALHWRLAEHIHRVVIERATSSARFCPVGQ